MPILQYPFAMKIFKMNWLRALNELCCKFVQEIFFDIFIRLCSFACLHFSFLRVIAIFLLITEMLQCFIRNFKGIDSCMSLWYSFIDFLAVQTALEHC